MGNVREWMTADVLSLLPTATAYEALELMATRRVRHVLIQDEEGELQGLVSNRDLVRVAMHDPKHVLELTRTSVSEIMTPTPLLTVQPGTTMADAAKLLYEHKIDAVPVLEDSKVAGILTTSDFLRTFWQT